ncbi:MAG: hypothetical protein JKY98_05850, partial [Gammaproteobacteria bacterium]|nr:hypothetical protein [Gammaproteobacteria bacterium]
EEQIAEAAGVEVTIDSLTGYFEGFNPVISLQGLQFQVLQADIAGPGRERALKFARATIILNMIQTIWQRQIVLENFVIEGLEIGATQREDGSWQISGMNLDSPTGTFDPNIVYKTIQRVSRLELTDLNVELQSLAGNSTRLLNSTAVIQNSSGNHFIHINTTVDGSDHEILVSAEVTGDTLDEVKGLLHINLPQADYSPSSINEVLGEITLGEMVGGGHAWIDLDKGQVQSIFLQGDIDSLNFRFDKSDMLTFEKLRGSARLLLDAGEGNWDFSIQNLQFNWNERSWSESGAHVQLDDDGIVRFKADSIDLDILREIVVASGLVSTGVAREINAFRPRGKLRNLSVAFPLQDDVESNIELSANIENVGVDSAHGSPDMTGINGYLELSHDVGKGVTQGVAEVESENFTIRIPNVFLDSWNYDYVNGRLNFRIESQGRRVVKLSSSMITAESDIVDGRAQFSSTAVSRDGKRVSQDLSLLVGVLRVDGNLKSPYLPTGPKIPQGLRSTMQWLDQALLDASVFDSGIIFHGSVMPGSLPLEKTFQAFFDFDDGQLNYVDEWPELYGVSGKAIVDNQDIDIRVENGRSLELDIGPTTGKVRRDLNGKQWLTVQGISTGTTQAGMDFLKVVPLGNAFADTFDSWQVQGNVIAELDLRIPFNQPAAEPWVNVSATLDSNSLFLPEYQLQFDNVTGVINFDTDTGLHDSVLQTRLFDNSASVSVTSTQDGPQGFVTDVQVDGVVDGNVLARWPGQSAFVRDLLLRTSGEMNYTAQLTVQQSPAQQTTTRLRINSDLQGLALLLPQPFQ